MHRAAGGAGAESPAFKVRPKLSDDKDDEFNAFDRQIDSINRHMAAAADTVRAIDDRSHGRRPSPTPMRRIATEIEAHERARGGPSPWVPPNGMDVDRGRM
jgi:hypothetical protein